MIHGNLLQQQDVFLMIRRKKLTIFTDAKDSTSVLDLKKIIEGKNNDFQKVACLIRFSSYQLHYACYSRNSN